MTIEQIFYNQTWYEDFCNIRRPHAIILESKQEAENKLVFTLEGDGVSTNFDKEKASIPSMLERIEQMGLNKGEYILSSYVRYPVPSPRVWRPDFNEMIVSKIKVTV